MYQLPVMNVFVMNYKHLLIKRGGKRDEKKIKSQSIAHSITNRARDSISYNFLEITHFCEIMNLRVPKARQDLRKLAGLEKKSNEKNIL